MPKIWHQIINLPQYFSNHWLEKKQTSIISAAFVITLANFLVAGAGVVRDRLLLSLFATSDFSRSMYDAYRVAFQVPDLIYQLLILGALSAAFIPVFTSLRKNDEQAAFKTTNSVMNILLLGFTAIGILAAIFAPQITNARIGAAYTAEQIEIVINLTRLMLIGQIFFTISCFFSGMLQSFRTFLLPAVAPLFYNLGIILGAFFLYNLCGIYGAGIGVIIGAILHMIVQYPSLRKLGWRWQPQLNFKLQGVKEIFRMMPARTLTIGVNELQGFGLSFFVTAVSNFGFTLISLARSLMILPIRLVGVPIGQAALPFLSNLSDEKSLQSFKKILLQSLNQISFLAFPLAVLLLILRIPAVRLAYGTSNFPWDMTVLVGRIVAILALSIPLQAMYHLLVRAFYALKNTRTPFIISIVTTVTYLLGCFLAVRFCHSPSSTHSSLIAIAAVISITALIETSLYLLLLQIKVRGLFDRHFVWSQIKIALASLIMAFALYIPFKLLDQVVFDTTRVIPLLLLTLVTAMCGIGVFILAAWLMRIKEMKLVYKVLNSTGLFKKAAPALESGEIIDNNGDAFDNN